MKNILQNSILPFALFASTLAFLGCNQVSAPYAEAEPPEINVSPNEKAAHAPDVVLKSGNMFYMIRDIADLQLKAGPHLEQLKMSKIALENAVAQKDQQQLQQSIQEIDNELEDFNQSLNSLNLQSQEIDQIRQSIMSTNQNLLATPLLNGQLDVSEIDIAAFEKQMNRVQNEMIKLAAMLITEQDSSTTSE